MLQNNGRAEKFATSSHIEDPARFTRLHHRAARHHWGFLFQILSMFLLLWAFIFASEQQRRLFEENESAGRLESSSIKRLTVSEQSQRAAHESWLNSQAQQLSGYLHQNGYQNFVVYNRLKSEKSANEKAERKGISVEMLNDYYGMRLVFQNELDVYSALATISRDHEVLRTKDYIMNPKASGYQSVHAQVMFDGREVELQMRTNKMHAQAEAEHEAYKVRMRQQAA